jgi:hypothetical protein
MGCRPTVRTSTASASWAGDGCGRGPVRAHGGDLPPAAATSQQVADELFLSVDAVKTHLRAPFSKFGIEALPQNQKRVRLVELALKRGVVTPRDL